MIQSPNRPVFLNLLQIYLPVTGVVSILHRITGVLWVLLLPFLAYLLQRSLESESGFQWVISLWQERYVRMSTLLYIAMLTQHFFSGVRHLALDLDIGIDLVHARLGAYACFIGTIIITAWLGVSWW